MLIPLFYLFVTFCFGSAVFNYKYHAFFFDIGLQKTPQFEQYIADALFFCTIHSIFVIGAIFVIYTTLCIVLTIRVVIFKNQALTKLQRLMFFQSLSICVEMFMVGVVYVYSEYVTVPMFMFIIDHISLLCVHGDTPIVYLLLNKSLRCAVFNLVTTRPSTS
uniref:Serpentine receptor class gamma n=1 Tax=Acrobeloides nanus TaxID=290746 RepID=A0A914DZ53_9BILA